MEKTTRKKQPLNLMFDIETLSTDRDRGCVVSVGIRSFSLTPERPPLEFSKYIVIKPESSLTHGRIAEADTVTWWQTRNRDAYLVLMREVQEEGREFYSGWNDLLGELRFLAENFVLHVWSKGIDFDFPMIESSLRDAGLVTDPKALPYRFYHKHDVRTILHLAKEMGWEEPRLGVPHSALGDCVVQINLLKIALGYLNGNRCAAGIER